MASFFRVAWRDSQSHCAKDFDTQEQAEAHVDRLNRTKLRGDAFWYEIVPLEPAYAPQAPAIAPLSDSNDTVGSKVIRKLFRPSDRRTA